MRLLLYWCLNLSFIKDVQGLAHFDFEPTIQGASSISANTKAHSWTTLEGGPHNLLSPAPKMDQFNAKIL